MLRVTIELLPKGDASKSQVIHVMHLRNIGGKASDTHGTYEASLWPKGVTTHLQHRTPINTGRVENFPRLRKNAWHLLAQMLRAMKYGI